LTLPLRSGQEVEGLKVVVKEDNRLGDFCKGEMVGMNFEWRMQGNAER
jgi:hypothetical protein